MARILLHPGDHGAEVAALVAAAWEDEECLVLCPSRVRDFRGLSTLPAGDLEWRGEWAVRPEVAKSRVTVFPEKPVFGVFTSGTSGGDPRLVYYSRRNIEASLNAIFSLFDTDRIEKVFCYPQPSHTFGLVLGYLAAHRFGWEVVASPGRYSSASHAQRLAIRDPRLLTLGTPAHFRDLLHYGESQRVSPAPSYSAIVGGAPVPRDLWLALRERLLIEAPSIGYGATEASPGVSHLPPGLEPLEDGEIGFLLPHLQVTLQERGLAFRGESLALAIVEGEQARFPEAGFLSDRIQQRADGRWLFEGRWDAVLNRGGEKFSLEQIEKILRRVLAKEVLATTLVDERLGEELGVLVVGSSLDLATRQRASEVLAAELGCRFAGARWGAVTEIPCGANRKPDRLAARAYLEARGFPIAASALAHIVPHRPPMVWIDEVTQATEEGGECTLRYRAQAAYAGVHGLRRSSLAEFLAQGYGFVQASLHRDAKKPKEAFLAALSRVDFAKEIAVRDGEVLTIMVRRVREMGPLALVEGKVLTARGEVLAQGQLKLFAR